jgi:hypothetical protein
LTSQPSRRFEAADRRVCNKAYSTSGSSAGASDLARSSLSTDNVFRDDKALHQLATVTGSVGKGYVANLTIGV